MWGQVRSWSCQQSKLIKLSLKWCLFRGGLGWIIVERYLKIPKLSLGWCWLRLSHRTFRFFLRRTQMRTAETFTTGVPQLCLYSVHLELGSGETGHLETTYFSSALTFSVLISLPNKQYNILPLFPSHLTSAESMNVFRPRNTLWLL